MGARGGGVTTHHLNDRIQFQDTDPLKVSPLIGLFVIFFVQGVFREIFNINQLILENMFAVEN